MSTSDERKSIKIVIVFWVAVLSLGLQKGRGNEIHNFSPIPKHAPHQWVENWTSSKCSKDNKGHLLTIILYGKIQIDEPAPFIEN